MRKVAKIAISLPGDILEVIEEERKAKGESRSEFFRRVVEALLRQQRQRAAVEQYMQGDQQMPEKYTLPYFFNISHFTFH